MATLEKVLGLTAPGIAAIAEASPGLVIRPKFTYVESLDFTSGGPHELVVGDTTEGETGGATGYIEHITITGGTWAGEDAAGALYLTNRNAIAFQAAETLKDNGNLNCATVTAASAKDSVLISSFVYHHQGTSEQLLYSDSKIAFEFQNLGASDWSYLYLDDSAIVTAGTSLITAAELIDATTEPAPSEAEHAEYNGLDRCFFAARTDGGSDILEFFHTGNLVSFADQITVQNVGAVLTTTFGDITAFTLPSFTREALATFSWNYVSAANILAWRTNGQAGTTGHYIVGVAIDGTTGWNTLPVITDANHIIELKETVNSNNTANVYQSGWRFPVGM